MIHAVHQIGISPISQPFAVRHPAVMTLLLVSILLGGCTEQRHLISVPGSNKHLEMLADAYVKVKEHYVDPVTPDKLSTNAIQGMEEFAISKNSAQRKPANTSLESTDNENEALRIMGVAYGSFAQDPSLDPVLLEYAAIKGMLKGLDPNGAFITREMYQEMQVETKGQFGGIGFQLGIKDDRLTIIAPIEGSPADRAGIKAGDFITTINGESTQNLTLFQAVQRLRGPKGAKISIGLERKGDPAPLLFDLVREAVKIKSIQSKTLNEKIGYIRIAQFPEGSARDLYTALKELRAQGIQACVLDLRNNAGGLLTESVDAAELFLGKNKLVVYTRGRQGRKDDWVTQAQGQGGPFQQLTLVALVNQGTAAGAEILAAALQDWGRAKILGTPTFGRGTVQTILPLKGGAGLRLTTSRSFSPKGRSLEDTILPDLVVPEGQGIDAPLSSALSELRTATSN